jgi:hypothetical protein
MRIGLHRAVSTGMLWSRWDEIVGPAVAKHAEPTSLRNGVLRVRTYSPVWATEIGYLRAQIQEQANRVLQAPVVEEVRVWTNPAKPAPSWSATESPGVGHALHGKARDREPAAARDCSLASSGDPSGALGRAHRAWRKGPKLEPEFPASPTAGR